MPHLDYLILQPTPFCNISCRYCYLPDRSSKARMTLETMNRIFSTLFASALVEDRMNVVWHAGEPLVLGTRYYADAIAEIARLAPAHVEVRHSLQTNGMLIDDEWCRFFRQHDVQVGVSIDGPQALNDINRLTRSGESTYAATIRGIRNLRRSAIDFTVITVLGADSLGKARELYDFYRSEGITSVCFNIEEIEGDHLQSSLSGEEQQLRFENFFRQLWNINVAERHLTYIREITDMMHKILQPADTPGIYNTLTEPFSHLTVDYLGNYSTFSPELLGHKNPGYGDFLAGHFSTDRIDRLADNEPFQRLCGDVREGVDACRRSCAYFAVCGGGAPANKYFEHGSVKATETLYCRLNVKTMANLAMEIIETSAVTKADEADRSAEADLYLLGTGVLCPAQLTAQTLDILASCRQICVNIHGDEMRALPEELRSRCVDLLPLFRDGRPRTENYRDVAQAVIAAVETERPVAYLTKGHPRVFDSITELLVGAGRERGWRVSVVPALSCIDTLLADLDYDPANGLLVHDASSLVAENVRLLPSVATLLLQPNVFGSDLAHLSPEKLQIDLAPLRDYLREFFPPDHRCAFVRSAARPGDEEAACWVRLHDLAAVADDKVIGASLFLPARQKPTNS